MFGAELDMRVGQVSCPPAQAEEQDLSSFTEADVKTLSSHQLVEFLSLLLQEVRTSPPGSRPGHLTALDPVT